MNNKGQLAIVAFMIAVAIIILALALIPAINTMSTGVMAENSTSIYGDYSDNRSGLNCNSGSITDFTKATCWAVDITQFWFIGALIALAGAVISAKVIFG